VTLLTAHKIFIASAVALFLLCAGWELRNFAGGDPSALMPATGAALAALGLAVYLRWVWVHRRSDRGRR
jgi:hypothetical protein